MKYRTLVASPGDEAYEVPYFSDFLRGKSHSHVRFIDCITGGSHSHVRFIDYLTCNSVSIAGIAAFFRKAYGVMKGAFDHFNQIQ